MKDKSEFENLDNGLIEGQIGYEELLYMKHKDTEKIYAKIIDSQLSMFDAEINIQKCQLFKEKQQQVIPKINTHNTQSRNKNANNKWKIKLKGGDKLSNNQINQMSGAKREDIVTKTIDEVIHDSMIPYTEHVVMDRALPRVEDGLKPVQRRILYSMMELGLTPDKQYRKSARIVGDCMGKYHPHGDSSVYDAMVRMAQDFSLRETLVDGHGNFGSMDGDSAAAMRYTEARLAPLALELLRDLEKNTVHWSLNFDDTLKEPDMLPGRFPNLLVNGASGIAVGVATNIPPHNLSEVIDGVCAYIKNPKITVAGLMKYIKAPDFPTGGIIIASDDLKRAYETGKGKIINRAKISIEKNGDKSAIVITEVPYQVNKSQMLQKIANLKENNKGGVLSYIGEIIDETDRSGLRAVIKIKKDGNPNAILKELLKSTQLEVSYNINMVAIAGGKPKLLGLKEIISFYVQYQNEIIIRRSKFDLKNAQNRAHIVDGLLKAIDQIDKIIKIIRSSKTVGEAKQRIINDINLSDLQAQAILDMRLARLVNLEIVKLQEELDSLNKLISQLREILTSKELQYKVIISELQDIKRRFGGKRKSLIMQENTIEDVVELEESAQPQSKPCIVAISADGRIKNIAIKNHAIDTDSLNKVNNLYEIQSQVISVMSDDFVYIFTNKGNCIKLKVEEIPESKWKRKGTDLESINKLVAYDERPVKLLPVIEDENTFFITYSKNGIAKRIKASELVVNRNFYQVMSLKEGDEVINVEYQQDSEALILFLTKFGYSLKVKSEEFPVQGRTTAGVKCMKMVDEDYIIFAGQVSSQGAVTIVGNNGFAKKVPIGDYQLMPRYRRGLKTMFFKDEKTGEVAFAKYDVEPNNICVKNGAQFDLIKTSNISYDKRASKGKSLIKQRFDKIFDVVDRSKI